MLDGDLGELRWPVSLDAGEPVAMRHRFTVEHPAAVAVTGLCPDAIAAGDRLREAGTIPWVDEMRVTAVGVASMNDQAAGAPVVVVLPPEIDVTNADQVYGQITAAFGPGVGTVVADMTGTAFCDSSGVHAIMQANDDATAHDVRMRLAISPDTSVRRVLQLIGVGKVIPVHESLDEALSAN